MPIHDWSRVESGIFHDFHQSWCIRIKDALNSGLLPKGLTALVEKRAGVVAPDVLAIDHTGWSSGGSHGGAATLAPPKTRVVRKSAKEYYSDQANRILVQQTYGQTLAVIELVSPGNKNSKHEFQKFVEKSRDFITKGIHLLVVDLFPPTNRDPHGVHQAIWEEFEQEDIVFEFPEGKDRLAASYEANIGEKTAYVQPLALGDSIPDMPLFLGDSFHVPCRSKRLIRRRGPTSQSTFKGSSNPVRCPEKCDAAQSL